MANLYNVDSPINREQRNNLNATFADILNRFGNLQRQINILAGGQEVDELISRLESAIANAETEVGNYIEQIDDAVQDAIDANDANLQAALQTVSDTLTQINTAITNAETATADATTAKDEAIQAANDAQNAVNSMQSFINNFGSRGQFVNGTQYYKNNIVNDGNGSSYIAVSDNVNQPLSNGTYWSLIASKGTKGDKGDKGDTGSGFVVLGYFNDDVTLNNGVPNPEPGDAYGVGLAEPFDIYIWDGVNNVWVNNGPLQGAKGDRGEKGESGDSTYQLALDNGFIGSEADFLASLKGEKGDPGETPDLTNIEQSIEDLGGQVATHLDKIGQLSSLKTTNKTSIVNAINEVFQNGNNVKADMVAALLALDNTLPISNNSTWAEIESAIAYIETGIDTSDATATVGDILNGKTAYANGVKLLGTLMLGKKWTSGTFTSSAYGNVYPRTLNFKPSIVLAQSVNAIADNRDFSVGFSPSAFGNPRKVGYKVDSEGVGSAANFNPIDNGFDLNVTRNNAQYYWIAIE